MTSMVQAGPLKLLTDGSLGGRSAFLRAPYSDAPDTCGIAVFTKDELNELVTTAHEAKMGSSMPCHWRRRHGDVHGCLSEKAQKKADRCQIRIIHLQITQPDILKGLKNRNVIAPMELCA